MKRDHFREVKIPFLKPPQQQHWKANRTFHCQCHSCTLWLGETAPLTKGHKRTTSSSVHMLHLLQKTMLEYPPCARNLDYAYGTLWGPRMMVSFIFSLFLNSLSLFLSVFISSLFSPLLGSNLINPFISCLVLGIFYILAQPLLLPKADSGYWVMTTMKMIEFSILGEVSTRGPLKLLPWTSGGQT